MQTQFTNGAGGPQHWVNSGRIISSLIVIGIGALFLLNNLHIIAVDDIWQFWPVVLIVVGIFKLVDSPDSHSRAVGGILLGAGGLFLAGNLGFLTFSVWELWPLLLIGVGVMMLVDRGFGGSAATLKARFRSGEFRESAVFGGGVRKFNGDFKGGKFDCVFGGFEIDLRQATMTADSAVLKIDAVFGGAEVKIPLDWSAVVQGDGVFGAFSDSTRQPNLALTPNVKTLYVKGAAVFGGVEVKN